MPTPPPDSNENPVVVDLHPTNAAARVAVAILVPLVAAVIVGQLLGVPMTGPRSGVARQLGAPFLGALGIASWLIGLRFYGLRKMGLRGGRPLFAGIGFAVLAWVALLVVRLLPGLPAASFNPDGQAVVEVSLLVEVVRIQSAGAGRMFFYLLLFEAFCTQLWALGVGFRALAEWRGPISAAVVGGLLFGGLGFMMFQESFLPQWSGLLFFLTWGVLYGIIRLRTGSILGMVLVQALASFSAWFVLQPPDPLSASGLQTIHIVTSALYAIIIWRLWPKEVGDYRV